jgi:hypothetical protein
VSRRKSELPQTRTVELGLCARSSYIVFPSRSLFSRALSLASRARRGAPRADEDDNEDEDEDEDEDNEDEDEDDNDDDAPRALADLVARSTKVSCLRRL